MIFPFKITNTKTNPNANTNNSHVWDKKKNKEVRWRRMEEARWLEMQLMADGEGLQANQAGSDRLEVRGEWEGVTEWEWERRKRVAAEWVKWEYGVRVFFFFLNLYIYRGILVFLTYIYKWVGSKSGFRPSFCKNPDPLRVFFFLNHTRPYNLSGQVKSNPLGLGWAGYLRVEYKLPYLNATLAKIAILIKEIKPNPSKKEKKESHIMISSYVMYRTVLLIGRGLFLKQNLARWEAILVHPRFQVFLFLLLFAHNFSIIWFPIFFGY